MQKQNNFFGKVLVVVAAFCITFTVMGCDSSSDGGSDNDNAIDIATAAEQTGQELTIADGSTIKGTCMVGTVIIPANATVKIKGTLLFKSGTTFQINEGATIQGVSSVTSYIIIDQGATINAIGTAVAPITFTSEKAVGSRGRSDWGGLIINGKAPINKENPSGEGNSGYYGGSDANDNSGTLQYVRVYFAGKIFNSEDELNGIAFQGVGDGTTVNYVQAHNCKDDGMEFFGGTVNVKHIVSTGNGDDQFDWTEGWQGKAQFIVLSVVAGESDDPRGVEGDNLSSDNDALPRSTVEMYNVSFLCADGTFNGGAGWDQEAFRIRRGTDGTLGNIYVGVGGGVDITAARGIRTTEASTVCDVNYVIVEGFNNNGRELVQSAGTLTYANETINATASYLNPANVATLADLATNGSAAFIPASVTTGMNPPNDGFFDNTANFIGAVNPADNWLSGWTDFPAQ